MIFVSAILVLSLWSAAAVALWGRLNALARFWVSLLGMLVGVAMVMLSARTVGLLWIVAGAMALLTSVWQLPLGQSGAAGFWRQIPLRRLLWATPIAVVWGLLLLWEPVTFDGLLPPRLLRLGEVAGTALAHHTWAVVGLALLACLMLDSVAPGREE